MPAIFHRLDDSLVEIIPTYPEKMSMSGKYVVDFPDHFDLELKTATPTRNDVVSKVDSLFKEKFVSFDNFITNNLLTNTDFTSKFVESSSSISLVENQFLPANPVSNPLLTFKNSFKVGTVPNTLAVMGRYPKKDHLEGIAVTSNKTLEGNKCILTKDIDISSTTSDQQGRTDFFLYFRSALKSYAKDRTLADTEKNEATPLTANRTGLMSFTDTQYDSDNRLRCFISGDNGNTFREIENLKVFSFSGRVETIKLAWVNYTDADLNLLSYTLMY